MQKFISSILLASMVMLLFVTNSSSSNAANVGPPPDSGDYQTPGGIKYSLAFSNGNDGTSEINQAYLNLHIPSLETNITTPFLGILLSVESKIPPSPCGNIKQAGAVVKTITSACDLYEAKSPYDIYTAPKSFIIVVSNDKIVGAFEKLDANGVDMDAPASWGVASGKSDGIAAVYNDIAKRTNTDGGSLVAQTAADPATELQKALSQLVDNGKRHDMMSPYFEGMFDATNNENSVTKLKIETQSNGASPPIIKIPEQSSARPATTWKFSNVDAAVGSTNIDSNRYYFKLESWDGSPPVPVSQLNTLKAAKDFLAIRIEDTRFAGGGVALKFAFVMPGGSCDFGDDEKFGGLGNGNLGWASVGLSNYDCDSDPTQYPLYCSFENSIFRYVYNLEDGTLNNTQTNGTVRGSLSINKRNETQTPDRKFINLDPVINGGSTNTNPQGFVKKWVGETGVCRSNNDTVTVGGGEANTQCTKAKVCAADSEGNEPSAIGCAINQALCTVAKIFYDWFKSILDDAQCSLGYAIGFGDIGGKCR